MEFSSSAWPFVCYTVALLKCLHVRGIDLLNQACPIFMPSVTFVSSDKLDGLTMLFPLSVHLLVLLDLWIRAGMICLFDLQFKKMKFPVKICPIWLFRTMTRFLSHAMSKISLFVFVQMPFRIKAVKIAEKNPPYHVCTQRHIYIEIMH